MYCVSLLSYRIDYFIIFFFFSSRRRHTRFDCDWSSDVCSSDLALQYAIDICTGMTVAHQVGIVHRDLKPANVLINQDGLLKIVDFGVAAAQREGDTQLTKTGYVIGSPKYMAPDRKSTRLNSSHSQISYAV